MFLSPPVLVFDYSTSLCDAQSSWARHSRFFADLSEGQLQLPQTARLRSVLYLFLEQLPLIAGNRHRQRIRGI